MPLSRPSETWSVIEENSGEIKSMRLGLKNIQEEVEQEMLTQSTLKGFGASSFSESNNSGSTNSKGSTLTSSFRALANTFKKTGNKMSTTDPIQVASTPSIEKSDMQQLLSEVTTPVKTQPSPLPSPATGDENDSRDVSIMDLGQSTIRLVSGNPTVPSPPALRPFTPTFEACYSPESHASPTRCRVTFEESLPPGAFPSMVQTAFNPALQSSPAPPPFIFGSPAHQISNNQFHSAAASVLAEMNERLGLTGTSKEVGMDLLEKKNTSVFPSASLFSQLEKPKTDVTLKFDKAHDRQFQQMEGIGDWYARKYGNISTHNLPTAQEGLSSRKRKSDALAGTSKRIVRPSTGNGRRVSKGQAPRVVSENIDDLSEERQAKRLRVSLVDNPEVAQRQASAEEPKTVTMEIDEDPKAQEEREKERTAIKKKLEVSRARRRSSMGRVSVGANKPALIPNRPKKGITSKFGFFSSAKNLVRNVWNRGIGANQQEPKPKPSVSAPTEEEEPTTATKSSNKPGSAAKLSTSGVATKQNGFFAKPSSTGAAQTNNTTASKSRSSTVSSTNSGARRAAIPSFSRLTTQNLRASNISTNGDGTGSLQSGTANSMGIRKSGALPSGSNARTSETGVPSVNSVVRKRTSTLLAPTASSLARMQHTVKPASLAVKPPANSGPSPMSKSPVPIPALTPSRIPTFTHSPRLNNEGSATNTEKPSESIFSNGIPKFSTSKPFVKEPVNEATKPRPLPGRRPRISRSRVIARVGAQRIASASHAVSSADGRRSLNTPKNRGSLNVRVSGIGNKAQTRESFTASHRQRLRQSEVLRRRSKVSATGTAMGNKAGNSSEEECGELED
ncbi:hypothetical protein Clacol_009016 [Clathrus columnatus]|uniref:Uncharacterized protein n=1 Tax=Clathrus columnatus TaxID=1419009 RepID=A0AAV5AML3_9AGAM|nr:hypothetical protein Clacol_009016 [Clathrus columnatus]